MCFLSATSRLTRPWRRSRAALPYADRIVGVGLDSSEVGNPPEKFAAVYDTGESGRVPPGCPRRRGRRSRHTSGVRSTRSGLRRIDHGVRSLEDPQLVARLAAEQIPLTVCPLVERATEGGRRRWPITCFPRCLEAGLLVSINSDDPAYFGGYIGDNYAAVAEALGLDRRTIAEIARNSFRSSFLSDTRKADLMAEVDEFAAVNSKVGG